MNEQLTKKIQRAIKLIQSAEKKAKEVGQPLEICYSGGKDSDVILELAKMANVNFMAIYKNTTIDPPYTIKHCQDNNVEILQPKKSFYQSLSYYGFPSRLNRHCCTNLKEGKVLDYAILGIRAEESNKRKEIYKEPEKCKVYSKKRKVRQYFPILDWTKKDVVDFINVRGIKLHPFYYNDCGHIDPTRRLGCMCCPLQSYKQRIESFKKYPNMVKLYVRGGGNYLNKHKKSKIARLVKDGYEFFCFDVFCERSNKKFQEKFKGNNLFGYTIDCKTFLENYFNIKFKD